MARLEKPQPRNASLDRRRLLALGGAGVMAACSPKSHMTASNTPPLDADGFVEAVEAIRRRAGPLVRKEISPASMHLLVGMVTSAIMQLVVDPPADVTERELLDELVRRVEAWVR